MNQRIFSNNQTIKNDAPNKETIPNQGFNGSGNLEEYKTTSTHDCGAKNINPPGKQIASAVKGKYRRLVISLMVSFGIEVKSIFDEESARRVERFSLHKPCATSHQW